MRLFISGVSGYLGTVILKALEDEPAVSDIVGVDRGPISGVVLPASITGQWIGAGKYLAVGRQHADVRELRVPSQQCLQELRVGDDRRLRSFAGQLRAQPLQQLAGTANLMRMFPAGQIS